jgi:hypothetical protein
MPRRAALPKAGLVRQIPLKLSPELAVDLHAFSEAHFGVAHTRLICEAVRQFIDRELESDLVTRQRFQAAKAAILAARRSSSIEPFRVIDGKQGDPA